MALTIVSSDSIGTGIRYDLLSEDDLWIRAGVAVSSTDNETIDGDGSNVVIIDGTLIGSSSNFVIRLLGGSSEVRIGETGSVLQTTNFVAVLLFDGNNHLSNSGTIFAADALAASLDGGSNSLVNYGSIEGGLGGIFLFGGNGDTIQNFGSMTATGTGALASGINSENEDVTIINAGTISSLNEYGINGGDGILTGPDGMTVINNGTISGAVGSVQSTNISDLVLNRGEMLGDVELGSGADIFKGRSGVVEGTVFGEEGNDFLAGGSEADILDGGNDNDEVYGRAGNDELLGGSGNDELFGNDGDDVLDGGAGIDILNGGRGDDNMNGGDDNDRLFGRDGVDNLSGGLGDDFMDGGNGDDRLVGGNGNDRIEGGDGIDTAVFTGAQADYTIQVLSNGAVRVIDDRGGSPNGTDILTNVEFLNFTDAIVDVAGL